MNSEHVPGWVRPLKRFSRECVCNNELPLLPPTRMQVFVRKCRRLYDAAEFGLLRDKK